MIRISTIFIAICMVLVAASLGLVLYAVAGISGTESAIVALTALTFLILYNAVSMRLRDRSDVGGQIADLSRGTADLARQVAEFGRRLAAVEGRMVSANSAGADCPGEVPSNPRQCHEGSAGLKYDGGSWGLTSAYEKLRGGTSATYGGLTSPTLTDTRFVLGGYLKLPGGTKLTAGWIQRDNEGSKTPKSDMYWTQAVVPIGSGFFFDGLLGELKYEDSANKATLVNLRGRYVVSKDTTLYVTGALMNNDGALALPATASTPAPTPVAGGKQGSVITGILYKF